MAPNKKKNDSKKGKNNNKSKSNLKQGSLFSFFSKSVAAKATPKPESNTPTTLTTTTTTIKKVAPPPSSASVSASATNNRNKNINNNNVKATPPPPPLSSLSQQKNNSTLTSKNTIWEKLIIGSKIGIYWKDDKCYYPCTIEKFDTNTTTKSGGFNNSRFFVRYDDGESEWTDMSTEKLRWLDDEDGEDEDSEADDNSEDEKEPSKSSNKKRSYRRSIQEESEEEEEEQEWNDPGAPLNCGGGGDINGRDRYEYRGDGNQNNSNNNNSNYYNNDGGGGTRFNNNNNNNNGGGGGGGGGESSRLGIHYGEPSRGSGDHDRCGGGGQSIDGNRYDGPSGGGVDRYRFDDRGGKGDNRHTSRDDDGGDRDRFDDRGVGIRNNSNSNYHSNDRGGGRRDNNGGGGGSFRGDNRHCDDDEDDDKDEYVSTNNTTTTTKSSKRKLISSSSSYDDNDGSMIPTSSSSSISNNNDDAPYNIGKSGENVPLIPPMTDKEHTCVLLPRSLVETLSSTTTASVENNDRKPSPRPSAALGDEDDEDDNGESDDDDSDDDDDDDEQAIDDDDRIDDPVLTSTTMVSAITKENKNSNNKDAAVVYDDHVEGEDGDDEPPLCTAQSSTAVSSNSIECALPECDRIFGLRGDMVRHFRNKHDVQLDGSCIECGIPIKRAKATNQKMPDTFQQHMSKSEYADFIARIRTLLYDDIKKKRYSLVQIAYLKEDFNKTVHGFGQQLLDVVVIKRGLLKPGSKDDAGGYLQKGFLLPKLSGIHQLSLDRKDNDLAHFLFDKSITENIRFVALGMNTQANIVSSYGNKTCNKICADIKTDKMATTDHIVNEQVMMKCSNANKLYRSSSNVYNHEDAIRKKGSSETEVKNAIKKFHEQFPVKQSVYIHVLELYRQQKGRCAISGLIMKLREEPDGNWYQVSIDAISPKKLHVKDNLQLVCRFLNCTNMEKSKSKYDANDTSGGWTTQSLYRYIGYSDN